MMKQIYLKRQNSFYNWMKEKQFATALVTSPTNIYYFTGFYTNPHERFMGLFFIEDQEPILITPELDALEARSYLKNVYGYLDSEGPDLLLEKYIALEKNMTFGIELGDVSYKKAFWLKQLLQIGEFIDIEPGLMALRIVKDDFEKKYLKEAAQFADQAIQIGVDAVEIGKSELEIIADIEYQLKKQGIEKMSFDTMVLTGLKSALPHGKPGRDLVKEGDFVLFDLGVVVNGYCSDISRTIIVGEPTDKQKEIYSVVKVGQQQAVNTVKPNIPIKDIDLSARNYIANKGYGEYFIHRIGHGLGLDVHELPSMHEKNEDLLIEGMVFTIEPGIYLPHVGGVRIEDDVYVTSSGVEVLTTYTKDLIKV